MDFLMVPESLEFLDFLEVLIIVALILGPKDAGALEKDPLTAHRNIPTATKELIQITSDFDAPS